MYSTDILDMGCTWEGVAEKDVPINKDYAPVCNELVDWRPPLPSIIVEVRVHYRLLFEEMEVAHSNGRPYEVGVEQPLPKWCQVISGKTHPANLIRRIVRKSWN